MALERLLHLNYFQAHQLVQAQAIGMISTSLLMCAFRGHVCRGSRQLFCLSNRTNLYILLAFALRCGNAGTGPYQQC